MPIVDSASIGRRVADARARAGLTQLELARLAGLDRTALAKIETGGRRITALELARVSEATGDALDWFVTDPPESIVSYRAHLDASTTSSIDRFIERVARDVELLQSLGELQVGAHEPSAHPADAADAVRLAAEARAVLGLPASGPFLDLAGPLASIGLFAFSANLGTDAPDAATTLLAHGGVSVVNSDRALGRRRLALAHELGHYLVADEYTVDWRVGAWVAQERTEALLDVFARALLLPAGSVGGRWAELVTHGSLREAAVRVASEYRVDMATLASRLFDLDLVDHQEASAVRTTKTTRADIIEFDLVVPRDLEATTLPRGFEKAVLALYRSERISAERAVDLLYDTIDADGLPVLPPVSEGEIWKFTS